MSDAKARLDDLTIDFYKKITENVDTLGQQYHDPTSTLHVGSATGISTNLLLRYCLATLYKKMRIKEIGLNVNTGVASSKYRIGIYDSKNSPVGDFKPNNLLFDTGDFDTSTTGFKSVVCDITLQAGIYFFSWLCGGGATAPTMIINQTVYNTKVLGFNQASASLVGYTKSGVAYGALPNPAITPNGYLTANVDTLKIFCRVTEYN